MRYVQANLKHIYESNGQSPMYEKTCAILIQLAFDAGTSLDGFDAFRNNPLMLVLRQPHRMFQRGAAVAQDLKLQAEAELRRSLEDLPPAERQLRESQLHSLDAEEQKLSQWVQHFSRLPVQTTRDIVPTTQCTADTVYCKTSIFPEPQGYSHTIR